MSAHIMDGKLIPSRGFSSFLSTDWFSFEVGK
jgi:hypothetical protein